MENILNLKTYSNVYFFENPHVTGFCIPLNKDGQKILEEYTD
jgi:hypothetical protein